MRQHQVRRNSARLAGRGYLFKTCAIPPAGLRLVSAPGDSTPSDSSQIVVEAGSVVLVTNEGNATLTTTLPNVHVAISGIEKIVPTL